MPNLSVNVSKVVISVVIVGVISITQRTVRESEVVVIISITIFTVHIMSLIVL